MSDRGLRYWLSWPHTRQDHVVAFAVLFAITLVAGYLERPAVTLLSAIMTVFVGIRLMAWNAEQAAAGEEEDAPLTELLGMGSRRGPRTGADDPRDHGPDDARAPGSRGTDRADGAAPRTPEADTVEGDGVDRTDERDHDPTDGRDQDRTDARDAGRE